MHDARCLRCYGRLVLLCRVMQGEQITGNSKKHWTYSAATVRFFRRQASGFGVAC